MKPNPLPSKLYQEYNAKETKQAEYLAKVRKSAETYLVILALRDCYGYRGGFK